MSRETIAVNLTIYLKNQRKQNSGTNGLMNDLQMISLEHFLFFVLYIFFVFI